MKRPLATVGFSYLLALVAAVTFGLNFSVIFAVLFALAAVWTFKNAHVRKKIVLPAVCTAAAVAFSVFSVYTYFFVQPVSLLYGREAYVYGKVIQEPYFEYDKYYTVLDVESVDIENSVQNFKMRVSLESIDDVEMSDELYLRVKFFQIPDRSIEYRRAKGVLIYGYQVKGTDLQIFKQSSSILRGIYSFKRNLTESVQEIFPSDLAQELTACLTGDTVQMDTELKNQFRRSGLSHLLAVSGLHLSIISCAVLYVLNAFKIKKRISYLIAISVIVLFMVMTGFSPSVVRAGIMTIIILAGKIINRKADSLNSLGFACLIMCLFRPYSAVDVGFMLSVAATLGLIVFTPFFQRYFGRKLKAIENEKLRHAAKFITDSLTVSFSALIPTIPVTLVFFKEISVVSPISNLLVMQLFSIFMIFGAVAALLSMFGFLSFLGKPFEIIALITGRVINYIIKFMSSLSFATVKLPYTFVAVWICMVLLLTAFALLLKKNTALFKKTVKYSLMIFVVGVVSYLVFNAGVLSVRVSDTNSGSMVIISKGSNCVVVGCGGDSYDMVSVNDVVTDEALDSCKAVVLPTLDENNAGNFTAVNQLLSPESVYCSNDGVLYDEISRRVDYEKLYSIENAEFAPFRNASVQVVTDENGKNWTVADYKNMRMLFCPAGGDAELLTEDLKKADLIFISSTDLSHASELKGSMYVVCADELNAAKIKLMLLSCQKENIITTGGEGGIHIKTRGGRNITVGRY